MYEICRVRFLHDERGNYIRVGTRLINLLDCCPFVYVTSPAYEPKVKQICLLMNLLRGL
jgi:hypothetical protein